MYYFPVRFERICDHPMSSHSINTAHFKINICHLPVAFKKSQKKQGYKKSSPPRVVHMQPTSSTASDSAATSQPPLSIRQQLRQRRELEDLRKFGLAPLARDALTGQEISPNIPSGLSQAPWYYGVDGPTLEHQRRNATNPDDSRKLDDQVDRVEVLGKQATFVAGACTNCGATTHRARDCLLPKKKVGAATSGVVSGVDQRVVSASADKEASYSKKRDGWSGNVQCDDLWKMHDEKRQREESEVGDGQGSTGGRRVDHGQDNALLAAFQASSGDVQSTDIKQLPRYLENLDAGAFYDPITRSMRGNPHAEKGSIHSTFRGENERISGAAYRDALDMQNRFLRGETDCVVDLNLDAAFKARRDAEDGVVAATESPVTDAGPAVDKREQLLAEMLYHTAPNKPHADVAPKPTLPPATSAQVEVISTAAPALHPSTSGGHVSTYGSFFDVASLAWGYQCCKQTSRGAACSKTSEVSAPSS
jgi:pre-mRNA-processing factor SLU7